MNDKSYAEQGDIFRISGVKHPVLVVSKTFFNKSGEIIGCPIIEGIREEALHIMIKTDKCEGLVHCEKLALLDLRMRHCTKIDSVSINEIIDITDAIQGIFDYI